MGKKHKTHKDTSLWKKGQSGNPRGRPTILPIEIQDEINRNKNALKKLILMYFNLSESQIAERQRTDGIPYLEKMLGQCFERTCLDGNVDAFRKLLEIVFGKLPEETKEFEVSEDEKAMILNYRQLIKLEATQDGQASHTSNQSSSESLPDENESGSHSGQELS